MFGGCSLLTLINFDKKFNTNRVENMSGMFLECLGLEKLDLSIFYTNNVTNMEWMFYKCSKLKELNLKNFNINKVEDMHSMFSGCNNLVTLTISNDFETKNAKDVYNMFENCKTSLINKIKLQNKKIKYEAFISN